MRSQFVKVAVYREPALRSDALRISAIGHIEVPAHFVPIHNLRNSTKADLYWDSEAQAIAIVFTSENATSAFSIFFTGPETARISARSFFTDNNIEPVDVAGEYRYEVKTAKEVGIADVAAEREVYILALDAEHRL
jgi:hypothetical protein